MQSVPALRIACIIWMLASPILYTNQSMAHGLEVPSESSDELKEGFLYPPASAKPRVWWHWMNGNITQEGIRKDLEWMKRIGIGGMQNFDGEVDTPQVVDKRLVYMSPEWKSAFKYAAELADQLDLELAIASSPGWSETGGPWVEPEDAMKKLVWTRTRVAGARPFKDKLAAPPSVSGPFQGVPAAGFVTGKVNSGDKIEGPRYYQDVAVLAYPTPPALRQDPKPLKITTNLPSANGAALIDGDLAQPVTLPASANQPAWVQYDYGSPQRFRAVSLGRPSLRCFMCSFAWVVEASDDGKSFRRVAELPSDDFSTQHTTVSFPEVRARFLRLNMSSSPKRYLAVPGINAPGAERSPALALPDQVILSELQFFAGARIHRFEDKAGYSNPIRYYVLDGGANRPDEAVDPKDIINLTGRMRADGTLDWKPPAGDWTVLRLGYSLTGRINHPASAEATGLEVDKLDKQAVKNYLDTYYSYFERTLGPDLIGRRGLRAFLTDSIESVGQNWTPAMISEFKTRRGYDPTPYLPALTGIIVGDATESDRFLWDFRKTVGELMSDAHYRQVAESARERSLTYYSESLEGHPTLALGDDLDMRQHSDIPMAAFWSSYKPADRDGVPGYIGDVRGAASVSHIFGQNLVAAEALTSILEPWAYAPAMLRPVIDLVFALGVNRPVLHTSVHQPVEKKPGLTLGFFGQHFTRHETWGELAGPWITYLSRSSYLLQQGRFVADVAWFYGEEGPLASFYTVGSPADLPEGHGYDFVNANILLNHLSAREGQLVSKGGARYRLLYLSGSSARMTLPVLRKLKEFSDQGIAIAGRRPTGSPSLIDKGREEEYRRLVAALWDSGKVIDSGDPNTVLAQLRLVRDFDYDKPQHDSHVMFLHRQLADGEIYFLTNRKARTEQIEARFRVVGRRPELWHADSGERERVSWRIEQGHTVVPLELQANQSVFVVFRERTDKKAEQVAVPEERFVASIDGDWQLSFEPGRGAPEQPILAALGSWSESSQAGVKYFSGLATYRSEFNLSRADLEGGARVMLDLGQVHEVAEVTLNGKAVGTVWHAPFRLDVTHAIKSGDNKIEIRVANLWVNRLIGDKQPGATPVAFTITSTYKADAPLRPSGLLGPVVLQRVVQPVFTAVVDWSR